MKKKLISSVLLALSGLFVLESCFGNLFGGNYVEGDTTYLHSNPVTKASKVSTALVSQGANAFPSRGNPNLLVVPVSFSDGLGFSTRDLENIQQTFFGEDNASGWESVASYYKKSSYGNLNIGGMIANQVNLTHSSTYYANNYNGSDNSAITTAMADIISEVYKALVDQFGRTDLMNKFDTDKDGLLDGIWMVYDVEDNSRLSSLFWAYTGWNVSDVDGGTTGVRNPITDYCWASISFMNKDSRLNGQDAHTFIHETGHLLGLEDYYDTEYAGISPFGGLGMMDNNILDFDAYSKWALGWINPAIYTTKTLTTTAEVTLRPFESSGDALVIGLPNNYGWFGEEYIILEYYTPTGINELDSSRKYNSDNIFSSQGYPQGYTDSGIIAYHVDSRYGIYTLGSNNTPSFERYVYTEANLDESNLVGNNQFFRLVTNNDADENVNPKTTPFLISIYDRSNRYQNLVKSTNTNYADNSFLYNSGDSLVPDSVATQTVHQAGQSFGFNLSFGEQNSSGATITLTVA